MSWLYGRPTAAELVAAVADFLDHDVRSAVGPDGRLADAARVNFHARVAANVLHIVLRELTDDSTDEVTAILATSGLPTRHNWLRRSAPARWTTARPRCCQSCAPWSAIG